MCVCVRVRTCVCVCALVCATCVCIPVFQTFLNIQAHFLSSAYIFLCFSILQWLEGPSEMAPEEKADLRRISRLFLLRLKCLLDLGDGHTRAWHPSHGRSQHLPFRGKVCTHNPKGCLLQTTAPQLQCVQVDI